MRVQCTKFTSSSAKWQTIFRIFPLAFPSRLKQHFLFDLGITKENEILAAKKTSYLSAMNNSSIKTVRKLQVILSSDKLPVKMKQSSSDINKSFLTCTA